MKIPQSIVNLNIWEQIQVEINSHKVPKYNFSKTLVEKVEVQNAKKSYKEHIKKHPSEHKQQLSALFDMFSEMPVPEWGSLSFNGVKLTT